MSKSPRRLTRTQVVRALTRLGELCVAAKTKAEIAIYGGTVMMFAFDCREMTKDVDAIFQPQEAMEPLIAQVARELKLPDDWLNAGVKPFVGARETRVPFPEWPIPGIEITRPSAEYLLAMKCMAGRLPTPFRAGDVADIKFLMRRLGIASVREIDALVRDYYGDRPLDEKLLTEVRRESKTDQ